MAKRKRPQGSKLKRLRAQAGSEASLPQASGPALQRLQERM